MKKNDNKKISINSKLKNSFTNTLKFNLLDISSRESKGKQEHLQQFLENHLKKNYFVNEIRKSHPRERHILIKSLNDVSALSDLSNDNLIHNKFRSINKSNIINCQLIISGKQSPFEIHHLANEKIKYVKSKSTMAKFKKEINNQFRNILKYSLESKRNLFINNDFGQIDRYSITVRNCQNKSNITDILNNLSYHRKISRKQQIMAKQDYMPSTW